MAAPKTRLPRRRVRLKKKYAVLLLTVSVFLAAGLLNFVGAFEYFERISYDFRVSLLAESVKPSDEIVLILLNQASIDWAYRERGWSWPWPRKAYTEFLDYMNIAGARSVAFDVLLSEASVYGDEDDETFMRASEDFGRAVQAVFFSTQSGKQFTWPGDLGSPLFNLNLRDPALPDFSLLREDQDRPVGAQFPIDPLLYSAGALGTVTGRPDSDGMIRRARLFTLFDNRAVPGLSSASLMAAGKGPAIRYDEKSRTMEWEGHSIPVDKNGASLLRFRGSLDVYHPYSIAQVLQSAESYARGEEPLIYPEDLNDKYIFFGFYGPGLFDLCSTPISSVYPGVGIHITMLDNLLKQDFIRELPAWTPYGIVLAVIILINLLVLYSGKIPAAVGGSALILLGLGGASLGAYAAGYWTPVAAPVFGGIIAFLTATLYNYATEGSQRRFIKSAFSQYLSPTVIEQLLANPEKLTLGGERREISIFFSDVQGFTTISEKLDPTQLTELLNDYLSFMTDTILESGGTIDKYEGDAIIAFWNAPVSYPDHAARALGASMLCQQKLAERQDFFDEKYGCRLLTRIGLNTGFAVVGNMGSGKRFDYTMLGDSVNLAARLEGLNKQFGTYLMCTEATFNQGLSAGPIFGRKLAQVAVVGKKEPVTVWEPMAEAVYREKETVILRFDEARDLFYAGNFAASLPLFEALADQDKPPVYYAEQCRHYLAYPGEWKGFWQAMSK
jgi:adenylate cyclase